jgi:F-box and leucine-rich repeat protein GRR1
VTANVQVKLIGCHRLTDLSIAKLVMNCPQIMELDLSKVPQITNAGVQAIWLHCVYLRDLKLTDNITITHEAFIDLVDPDEEMAYSKLKIDGLMVSYSLRVSIPPTN